MNYKTKTKLSLLIHAVLAGVILIACIGIVIAHHGEAIRVGSLDIYRIMFEGDYGWLGWVLVIAMLIFGANTLIGVFKER